jgi:hypothetical protein
MISPQSRIGISISPFSALIAEKTFLRPETVGIATPYTGNLLIYEGYSFLLRT